MPSTENWPGSSLRARIQAVLSGSFLRFFAASLFGLVLDIALAGVLNLVFGFSLVAAAAVSLTVVAAIMYLVHEFWTFREGERRLSATRMTGTILSALLALAVRTACLYASSVVLGLSERLALFQLLVATGASFVLNYVVVRRIVGGRGRKSTSP